MNKIDRCEIILKATEFIIGYQDHSVIKKKN